MGYNRRMIYASKRKVLARAVEQETHHAMMIRIVFLLCVLLLFWATRLFA
jgi:hypothetical protein